jgi:hypothetical protein
VLEDGAWYTPLRRTASRRYLDIELMLHDYQIVKFLELFGTEAWSILQPETNGRRVSKKERKSSFHRNKGEERKISIRQEISEQKHRRLA